MLPDALQRPTITLNLAARPPRSCSSASFEMPPSPRMPGTRVYWTSAVNPSQRPRRNSAPPFTRYPTCRVLKLPSSVEKSDVSSYEVRADPGSDVRHEPWRDAEAVSAADLNGCLGDRQRDTQPEILAVEPERAFSGRLETGQGDVDEEDAPEEHLCAAPPERFDRFAEHRVERFLCREVLSARQEKRPHGNRRTVRVRWAGLRLGGSGGRSERRCEHQHEESRCRRHRASPSPRRTLRASTSPKPYVSSRPAAPRSTANLSSAASTAAGFVTPCWISIAATPAT